MSHRAVSPAQFGFLTVSQDEWSEKTLDTAMHPEVERVQRRISTKAPIHTGQEHIYPDVVEEYASRGKRAAASRRGDRAEVYDAGGKLYMGDGHHRMAAARAAGQKSIRVDYWKAP